MKAFGATFIPLSLLIATPIFAADLPVKAPPPVAPELSWTGFYVGGNGGYAWNDPTVTFTPNDLVLNNSTCSGVAGGTCPPPISFNTSGGLGGLQAGYNYQFNRNWLLGFETDFDWSDIRGSGTSNFTFGGVPAPAIFQASEDIRWFGTVRGRLGWVPQNNLLLYVTGGLSYGRVDQEAALTTSLVEGGSGGPLPSHYFGCTASITCFQGASSHTDVGWVGGAGVEYALWKNISVKAEYLYVNLGGGHSVNAPAVLNPFAFAGFVSSSFTAGFNAVDFQLIRVGLNYKF